MSRQPKPFEKAKPFDKTEPFDKPEISHKPCPICGKPAAEMVAPFCSKRCADVDLHRWLGGVYAIPDDEPGQSGVPDPEDDKEP